MIGIVGEMSQLRGTRGAESHWARCIYVEVQCSSKKDIQDLMKRLLWIRKKELFRTQFTPGIDLSEHQSLQALVRTESTDRLSSM